MSNSDSTKQSSKPLLVSLLALAATAITFLLVYIVTARGSYIFSLFFERGWIQYMTCFCFWIINVTLYYKQLSFKFEREAYLQSKNLIEAPEFGTTLIWSDAGRIQQKFTDKKFDKFAQSISFSRIINSLDRLRKTQSTKEFDDYFGTRSNIDFAELESSYAGIRYFTWLIPTLGFIGTVMGIGIGIKGFASIIAQAKDFKEIQQYLPTVTNSLGTAFDTTLLALALSTIAVFYMSFLLKQEEHLLEKIDNLCFDGVCPLFQEHSKDTEKLIEALSENVENIRRGMNGNRAAVENVIKREFPALLGDELAPQFKVIATQLEKITKFAGKLLESSAGLPEIANGDQIKLATLGNFSIKLEKLLDKNGKIVERAAKILAESNEGNADVLSALTKLINRIEMSNLGKVI